MEFPFKNIRQKYFPVFNLLVVFLLSLAVFLFVEIFRDRFYFIATSVNYLAFHNLIEFFSAIVSISIFGVGWFSYKQSKNSFTLFLGIMFLSVGILDFFHALVFPGMPGLVTPGTTNMGIQFWLLARFVFAVAMIIGAFIPSSVVGKKRFPKNILLLFAVGFPILSVITLLWFHFVPVMFIEGKGLTPLKIVCELVVMILLIFAFAAFFRRFKKTNDKMLVFYLEAFILCIFSEFAFTFYQSAYDTFNMIGHLYKAVAFGLIYRGIFITSVNKPYELVIENEQKLKSAVKKLQMLSNCNQAIVHSTSEKELLEKVCENIVNIGKYLFVWVGYEKSGSQDGIDPAVKKGILAEKCNLLGKTFLADVKKGAGPGVNALRGKKPVVIQSVLTNQDFSSWRDEAKNFGYASIISLPLIFDKKAEGILNIYAAEPDAFSEDEVSLLTELADDLSFGIKALRDTAAKKKIEEDLRESEGLHRALIEAAGRSGIGLVILQNIEDREGVIVSTNEAASEIAGYSKEEIINKLTFGDVISPDEIAEITKKYRARQEGKSVSFYYETALIHKNKTRIPVMISLTTMMLHGKIATVVFFRDVTEKKQTEERIKHLQEYLQMQIDRMPIGLIVWDRDFRAISWNPAATRIFGFSEKEALGKRPYEFIVSKKTKPFTDKIWASLLNGKYSDESTENENLTKAGKTIICEWINAPLKGGDGEISSVLSMVQDITERKRSEKELKEHTQELENIKKSLTKLTDDLNFEKTKLEKEKAKDEALLAGISDGVVAVDKAEKVIYSNKATEALLGWSAKEIMNKPYYQFLKIQDKNGKPIPKEKRPTNIALVTGEKASLDDCFYIRKDNTKFFVSITNTPIILEGKTVGAMNVFRDVTREKEIEKLRMDFLSLASHQLRTPLSGIKWLIETMKNEVVGNMTIKQRKYVNNLYQINEQMIGLVSDMLDTLRLEGGNVIIKKENALVSSVMRDVLLASAALVKKKKINLQSKLKDKNLKIKTDQKILKTILQTILFNAIDYSHKRGKVIFEASTQKDGDIIFLIQDFGIGVPKNEQKKIFDRFYRASNAKIFKPGGSGLGLPLSQMLAEKLGGKIFLRPGKGKGSIFYLTLPQKVV